MSPKRARGARFGDNGAAKGLGDDRDGRAERRLGGDLLDDVVRDAHAAVRDVLAHLTRVARAVHGQLAGAALEGRQHVRVTGDAEGEHPVARVRLAF